MGIFLFRVLTFILNLGKNGYQSPQSKASYSNISTGLALGKCITNFAIISSYALWGTGYKNKPRICEKVERGSVC